MFECVRSSDWSKLPSFPLVHKKLVISPFNFFSLV